ncbi:MAG: fimbria/pilus outer membrane usher protein [Bdellovibrionales bacterium]|nr:fimbria/pilus outer membrane usher protein [Bdellovibrionales bacterium]
MRRLRCRLPKISLNAGLSGMALLLATVPVFASSHSSTSGLREALLGVRINSIAQPDAKVLLSSRNRIWVEQAELSLWRLKPPPVKTVKRGTRTFFPLDAISGVRTKLDEQKQELLITASAEAFLTVQLTGAQSPFIAPNRSPPGGFLNYDLIASGVYSSGTSQRRLDGAFEAGAFSRLGVATSTFLAQDIASSGRVLRLDTTWTHDNPENLSSYRIGDSISKGGAWGRPIRFGGFQWATNFSTQPGFISFPLPALRGETALPSTVDVYVNNALQSRQDLPPGPFEITNVPLVTGQGEVQLVVRDLLGRERLITQSYYVTPSLLKKGLRDYSLEAGIERINYAVESGEYGQALFSGTYRYGLTDQFTPELHSELQRKRQNVGLTSTVLWYPLGTFNASLAASRTSTDQTGGLLGLGYQRSGKVIDFGLQSTLTSKEFSQLGQIVSQGSLRRSLVTQLSFFPSGFGNWLLSYIDQDYRRAGRSQLVSAGVSFSPFSEIFASLSATHSLQGDAGTLFSLNLSRSLGPRTTGLIQSTQQSGKNTTGLQAQRNLEDDPGFGYRVLAEHGENDRGELSLLGQSNFGNYSAEISAIQGRTDSTGWRLGTTGGVSLLAGAGFLSRRLTDSFGVVQVDGYSNVRVYLENRPVGRTRYDGRLLIPRLRPYDINRLSIDPSDLPLDAKASSFQLEVAPYYRSGVVATFPVSRSRSALIRIILENGRELPAGSQVRVNDQLQEFPVGLHGEVFITDLKPENRLQASWNHSQCTLKFTLPDQPLPTLGPLLCKRVSP